MILIIFEKELHYSLKYSTVQQHLRKIPSKMAAFTFRKNSEFLY